MIYYAIRNKNTGLYFYGVRYVGAARNSVTRRLESVYSAIHSKKRDPQTLEQMRCIVNDAYRHGMQSILDEMEVEAFEFLQRPVPPTMKLSSFKKRIERDILFKKLAGSQNGR